MGEIGRGLCVLLGVARGDTEADAAQLAGKVARLRVFEDESGRFDRSLLDVGGSALVVSQFTLLADTAKGNRPSFSGAAPPEEAEPARPRPVGGAGRLRREDAGRARERRARHHHARGLAGRASRAVTPRRSGAGRNQAAGTGS